MPKTHSKRDILFSAADAMRKKYVGDGIGAYALINFSNYCRNNCLYCGMRRNNNSLKRYRMEPDEVIAAAKHAHRLGYPMITLMSGEDPEYPEESLAKIAKDVTHKNVMLFVAIGEREPEVYKSLRYAGVHGAQMRFETSSKALYEKLKPGASLERRVNRIALLQHLSYYVCTGSMVDLPGQSCEDIAKDLVFVGGFAPEMVSTNPYVCSPQTPLAGSKNGDVELGYEMIALSRVRYPRAMIPVTFAHQTLDSHATGRGFQAGANMIMVNATPRKYVEGFALYPNMFGADKSVEALTEETFETVQKCGRRVLTKDELDSLFHDAGLCLYQ